MAVQYAHKLRSMNY